MQGTQRGASLSGIGAWRGPGRRGLKTRKKNAWIEYLMSVPN